MMASRLMFVLFLGFIGINLSAQPANDDPCDAITLSIGSSCAYTSYTNSAATPSTGIAVPGCANYQGGDVWFKFTMPNNGFHIWLDMRAGSLTDGGMAVYSGSDCNSLSLVTCDDDSGSGDMPMLIVDDGCMFANAGQTFWVRVWEDGNDNNGTFDICAYGNTGGIPSGVAACGSNPLAGNTCCDAILLSDLLDGYCGNTGSYTASPVAIPSFCAALENNTWIAFNASATTVEIDLTSSNCLRSDGIQAVIYQTSDCSNFSNVSNCWTPNPAAEGTERLTATGLTPGDTYYLMVDGWAGDSCDYTISVVSGVEVTNVTTTDDEICLGGSTQLQVNVVGVGPYTYQWAPAGSLDDHQIANPVATPTVSTDYSVTVTGPSSTSTHTISIIVHPAIPATPAISGSNLVCQNSNGVTYNANASYATTYNWTVNGGGAIVGSNTDAIVSVDWGASGGNLCVTATNECGTSAQSCMTIGVLTRPIISVNDPPVACSPSTVNIASTPVNNTGSGGTGFFSVYYYADQVSAEAGTPVLPSPVVNTSGTYWVRMQTSNSCYDVTSINVTIESPAIVVVDPATTCAPNTIDLASVSVTEPTYGTGTKTYYNNQTDAENATNALSSSVVTSSNTYWVRYETSNSCSDVAAINVDISLPPDIADVSPEPLCPGESIDLDTVTLVDANSATITATHIYDNLGFAQSNLTFLALSNTVVTGAGNYWIWNGTADGCFDITQITISEHTPPTGSISGGGMVCPGDSIDLQFNLTGNGPFDVAFSNTSQNFTLTGIPNGHIERVPAAGGTSYIFTSLTDVNGCTGTISGPPVVVSVSLPPDAVLSGGGTVCENTSANLTFNLSGVGPFTVVYNDGSQDLTLNNISDGHVLSVTLTSSTTYSLVSVSDAGGCSGTITGTAGFTVYPELLISNRTETCNSAKTAYTVRFEIRGGNPATYAVSGAGTLMGNVFTSNDIPSNTPYNFIVSDASGCPTITVSGQRECLCTTNAGTMQLNALTACADATATATHNLNETLEPNDLFQYAIHDNAGATLGTVYGYNNTPTFGLLAGMTTGQTYYISPVAGPEDGSTGNLDLAHACFSVGQGTPVTFVDLPVASMSGGANICEGAGTTLTFNFSTGSGPFDVSYSANGSTLNLDDIPDGHQITVTPTATTTYTLLSVSDNTAAACSGTVSGNATITVTPALTVLNITETCNPAKTEYIVSFDISGGDPGSYAVSGAGTLTGNTFVSDPVASGGTYSYIVSDGSPCSDVTVSATKDCDCLTDAGTMDGNLLEACTDEMVTAIHNGDEFLDPTGPDILRYVLHENSGASPGIIYATNTTPEFGWTAGMVAGTTYYISAIAGPDNGSGNVDDTHKCYRMSPGTPVIFRELPVATISGTTSICIGESTDLTINFTAGSGPFDVLITDGNGNDETLTGITNGYMHQVTPTVDVNYTILNVLDNTTAACSGAGGGNAAITVIAIPEAGTASFGCNSTNTDYQVSFEITGGDPLNYTVSAGAGTLDAATNIFTSDWISSGSTYYFEITDGTTCGPVVVTGDYTCSCTTDAGLMLPDALEVCADQPAVGTHLLNSFTLDGNDVLGFVLHDSPNATLGTILLTNSIAEFSYDPILTYGTTYYISSVIANDDGSGAPVLDSNLDICMSVSVGQPVTFYEVPTVVLSGAATICEGDTTQLTFSLSGDGPFNLTYSDGTNTFNLNNITDGYVLPVHPDATTTYTLQSIQGSGTLSCVGTIDPSTATVTIDVIDVPDVSGPIIDCNINGTAFTVAFNVTGGSGTYQISGDTSFVLAGNSFTSRAYAGGDTYYFEINDGSGCPPIIITDTEFCNCTPDIRPLISQNEMISCAGAADGALSVIPINGLAPHSFAWSSGAVGTDAAQLTVGWHYVTMTDANNCESVDSFFLQEPTPVQASLVSTPVSCFGDEDGSVNFTNVTGGTGNFKFLLNGETSFFDSTYFDVDAGAYEGIVIDENGCEWRDSIIVDEPAELDVELGDDQSILLGDSLLLHAQINLSVDTFYWSPEIMVPCMSCMEQYVKPENTVVYRIRVVNEAGCEAEDAVLVHVRRDVPVYIPSAFTPNGDGFNDTFTIYGNSSVDRISVLRIFARWGALVYEVTDLEPGDEAEGWDGTLKNKLMGSGVFIYYAEIILADGTKKTVQGDFTLIH